MRRGALILETVCMAALGGILVWALITVVMAWRGDLVIPVVVTP